MATKVAPNDNRQTGNQGDETPRATEEVANLEHG
jgi:hypothetical protein